MTPLRDFLRIGEPLRGESPKVPELRESRRDEPLRESPLAPESLRDESRRDAPLRGESPKVPKSQMSCNHAPAKWYVYPIRCSAPFVTSV